MKFPQHILDEIRARVPVSEVVGARVKLKKAGREWSGLSPFNAEKSPSFFVNDEKRFYHDFSSGRHGDIFSFLVEVEGLSFPESVERLAAQAGVALPKETPAEDLEEKRREALRGALAQSAALFERFLHEGAGAKARGYLADRRIEPNAQRLFGIGFAPGEGNVLREALLAKGVDRTVLLEAGLLAEPEDGRAAYDRFRDRVMFPIHDRSGKVVAFGGRAMNPAARAKYLNSPETPLFHKGELLFNHHRARKSATEAKELIVVEGYVDVVMMTQGGFANTVAPLGTALTVDQCRLLWTMADEPTLCFDGDGAGLRAAYRALELALPLISAEKTLKFALLPEGQDPDDVVRVSGPAAMRAYLAKAEPLSDMLFRRETFGQNLDTPEKRAALERRLSESVRQIADEPLRRHYLAAMRAKTSALFGGEPAAPQRRAFVPGQRRLGKFDTGPRLGILGQPVRAGQGITSKPLESRREIAIMAILLNHPALGEAHYEAISALELGSKSLAALRDALAHLPPDAFVGRDALRAAVEEAGLAESADHVLGLARRSTTWRRIAPEAPLEDAETVLRQALALHRKYGALHRDLRAAERELALDPSEDNLARLRAIKASLDDLADAEASAEGFGGGSDREDAPI